MSKSEYYKPDELNGICVVKRNGETSEDLIRRFRKKFAKSGITKELREKMYHEKPSDRKRRKRAQSIRLLKKEEEKAEKMKERAIKYKQKQKRNQEKAKGKGDINDPSNRKQSYRRRNEKDED